VSREEFIDRINRYPSFSKKATYIENYYSKRGYNLFTYRPNRSDQCLFQLFTDNQFRRLLASQEIYIRESLQDQLIAFWEHAEPIIEKYENNEFDIRSKVKLNTDVTVRLNDIQLQAQEGQYILVGEKENE
jgi:hypothetical protein